MKKIRNVCMICFLVMGVFGVEATVFAKSSAEVPVDIQVSLFTRLLYFHKGISNGGDIRVYVIDSREFARALKKEIGKKIGDSVLVEVIEGKALPEEPPSVIYVNRSSLVEMVTAYSREQKVLSITGNPDLVSKGITLGLGIEDRKPKILLNLISSVEEAVDWNHAILKVAATFK